MNKRLLLYLHQDGLFDMLAGLMVITFGLIPIFDALEMGAGLRQIVFLSFYFLEVLLVIWLKRQITLPRAGLVLLHRDKRIRMSLILLFVNVFIFLIFAGSYAINLEIWDMFGSYQLSIPLGLVFLIMFTVSGALLKAIRFFGYGILVFISFVLFEYLFMKGWGLHHGIPAAACISGGIIFLSGAVILRRFLNLYRIENE